MIVDNNTYFITHNEKDIFHYGWVEKGQALDSGQPILERFASKSQFLARCSVLNIEVNIDDVPDFPIDTTPPTPTYKGVIIPEKYSWVFTNNRFELNNFVVEFQTVDNDLVVDTSYIFWEAFRNELDKPENITVKASLMPVWDYVVQQIIIDNTIDL